MMDEDSSPSRNQAVIRFSLAQTCGQYDASKNGAHDNRRIEEIDVPCRASQRQPKQESDGSAGLSAPEAR